MIELGDKRTVFVDVDDTLILYNLDKRLNISEKNYPHIKIDTEAGVMYRPEHRSHIDFIYSLKQQGYRIVVWSAAGGEWAAKIVKALQLEGIVDVTMSKPEFVIDDMLDPKRIIKSIFWINPETNEIMRNT